MKPQLGSASGSAFTHAAARFAALLLAGALSASGAWAQQFTLKLSTSTSNDALVEWLTLFKAGIETRSGGKIRAQLYPASQLGSVPRTIEGVALGTIEVAMNASGFYEGIEPRFAVLAAPGLFDSAATAQRVLADPAIRQRLATFGADKGVEVLTVIVPSPYTLVSQKPMTSLADFKGQKIRVPGSQLQIEPLKRLGALPVSMSFGEVLPALQNKTIDGVWASPPLFTALKYYDVAKNMTLLPATWASAVALVNRKFMQSLGPELAAMVRDEAHKADLAIVAWAEADMVKSRGIWAQNGGKEITLPAADAQRFIDEARAATLPLLSQTPQLKADYEAFQAAARNPLK